MKTSLVLCVLISLIFSCRSAHHTPNPEAVKLNDSAAKMWHLPYSVTGSLAGLVNKSAADSNEKAINKGDKKAASGENVTFSSNNDSLYKFKLRLLNQAVRIDSNYFIAYWNKFGCEYRLKRFHDATVTGEHMMKIRPHDTIIMYMAGRAFDKTGDTIRARMYYTNYLTYCKHILDTMSVKNRNRSSSELQEAIALILLDQPQKGHDILNKLYHDAEQPYDKDYYLLYMRLNKADLLSGKDTSITVGDRTTSINTLFP